MSSIFYSFKEYFILIEFYIPGGYKKRMDEKEKYNLFLQKLNEQIKCKWYQNLQGFAAASGVTQGNISKIKNENVVAKPETQIKLVNACGYKTVEDFIKTESNNQNNIVTFRTKLEKEHFEIIKTFEDPKTALEFNRILSFLEKFDNDVYIDLYGEAVKACKKAKRDTDGGPPGEERGA